MVGLAAVAALAILGGGAPSGRSTAFASAPLGSASAGQPTAEPTVAPTVEPSRSPRPPRIRLDPPVFTTTAAERTITVSGRLTRGTGPIQVIVSASDDPAAALASMTIGPLSTPTTLPRGGQPFEVRLALPGTASGVDLRIRVVVHGWNGWPLETSEFDVAGP